jgi:hypothetical protein
MAFTTLWIHGPRMLHLFNLLALCKSVDTSFV